MTAINTQIFGPEAAGSTAALEHHPRPRYDEGVLYMDEFRKEKQPTHLVHGHVSTGGGVDWTLEVPENPTYQGLTFFVPGYLGIKQSSREPRKAGAQLGEATLSYSPAREDGLAWYKGWQDPQFLHVKVLGDIYDDVLQHKEQITRLTPGATMLDFERVRLKLHSMGGLAGPRFALNHSSSVESLVGYATVGFGHPTIWELAQDIPSKAPAAIKHELIPGFTTGAIEMNIRNARDFVRYYSRLRVLFEGLSCIRDKTIQEVDSLADKNIPYHYVAFENDILVRPSEDISEFVSSFHVMKKYGHLAPQVKADKVARTSGRIILASAA